MALWPVLYKNMKTNAQCRGVVTICLPLLEPETWPGIFFSYSLSSICHWLLYPACYTLSETKHVYWYVKLHRSVKWCQVAIYQGLGYKYNSNDVYLHVNGWGQQ